MGRSVVVVVVAAIGLAACSGGSAKTTSATTAATSAATATTATTVGTTTTTVADGRVPAYLKTLDTSTRQVTYDQIQFLTGDAAKKAWLKDHPDQPDGPDDDYYIVNANPALYTVTIAPDAAITLNVLADGGTDPKPATLDQLKAGLAKDGSENIPFWLTIKAGVITKIEEQFVP